MVRPLVEFQGPLDFHGHGSWSLRKVARTLIASLDILGKVCLLEVNGNVCYKPT